MKFIRPPFPAAPVNGGKRFVTGRKNVLPGHKTLLGAFVSLQDGKLFGQVQSISTAGQAIVKLAVPDMNGALLVTDCTMAVSTVDMKPLGPCLSHEVSVKRGDALAAFSEKKLSEIKDKDGVVVDFRDVTVEGMASTFASVTPADRDGDRIDPGAFNDTVAEFLKNPVLLIDHRNSVDSIAGSFTKVSVTPTGLAVRAEISNAPELRKVRFLVAEGHLKAFSIGGFFFFGGSDGHTIEKVKLFEVSLVAVPANPDALFHVRSLTADDVRSLTAHAAKKSPAMFTKLLHSALAA